MPALAHDFAFIQNYDLIRIAYCAYALGDYDAGGIGAVPVERLSERLVGFVVERGEGVVKYEYFGFSGDSAGD